MTYNYIRPFDSTLNREFLELNALRHMRPAGSLESNTNQPIQQSNNVRDIHKSLMTRMSKQNQPYNSADTAININWRKIVANNDSRDSNYNSSAAMLDMGSCTCVVGIGGSNTIPRPFPTISLSSTVVGDEVAELADRLSHEHSISLPILHANETGVFTYAEPVYQYALNRLPADSYNNGCILMADQLIGGQNAKHEMANKRHKVAELVFKINPLIPKIAFVNESLLSLLSTGRTTGIVLHIGFARSTCAVIVDSKIQNLVSLPTRVVGGQLHSRMMLQSVFARGQAYQPSIADMFTHVPLLKQYCYVCSDPDEELKKPVDETSVDVELDSKTKVTLQQERFTSSEVFFFFGFPAMVVEAINSASTWECNSARMATTVRNARDKHTSTVMASQHSDSAQVYAQQQQQLQQQLQVGQQLTPEQIQHAAALQAQQQHTATPTNQQAASHIAAAAPEHQHAQHDEANDVNPELTNLLLQNIVLSGRSAAFPGFASRFQGDLNYILKKSVAAKVVSADLESTWLGGSVLCKLSVLDSLCVTRDEFARDPYGSVYNKMEFADTNSTATQQSLMMQQQLLTQLAAQQQQILAQQQHHAQMQQQQAQQQALQQQQMQATMQPPSQSVPTQQASTVVQPKPKRTKTSK